jgi:hypothetical protein
VVGIAGPDAHAFKYPVGPLTVEIFPYKVHFKCLRTHIVLPEPMSRNFERAREQLYDAIRDCRVFSSNMRWGSADSFEFYAQQGDARVPVGGVLDSYEGATIHVKAPAKATLRLVCSGQQVCETLSDRLAYRIAEPGVYRVEAWKGKRGWVFTNHIRIGV